MTNRGFVELAGFLAERGVLELTLSSEGRTRVLRARQTDLVAELVQVASAGGTLTAPSLRLEITIPPGGSGATWACPDAALTMALAKRFAAT